MYIPNKLLRKIVEISRNNIDKPESKFKHFSFLTQKNNIICFGYNNIYKSHPWANKYNYRNSATHSELHCLIKYPFPLLTIEQKNLTLINIRLNKGGQVRLSRPCINCQELLASVGVSNICYSVNEFKFEQL